MDRIASQIALLRYLAVAVPNQRKQLLRSLSREQINTISEICLNLLKGNVDITDRELSLLSKHKNTLRKLSVKSVDSYTKRELMCKDATGIKTLIVIFLKHFDNYSYGDTSASDDEDDDDSYTVTPSDPAPTRATEYLISSGIGNNGLGERERLSETHFDSRFEVPTTDSETAAAAAAARTASTTNETTTTNTNIE
jgi:hypothetical protein